MRRAPKEMGGLLKDITDRLPAGVRLGKKATVNLGKIMKKSTRVPGQKVHGVSHAQVMSGYDDLCMSHSPHDTSHLPDIGRIYNHIHTHVHGMSHPPDIVRIHSYIHTNVHDMYQND